MECYPKTMKLQKASLLAPALLGLAGCQIYGDLGHSVEGSGKSTQETRTINGDFKHVAEEGAAIVDITVGPPQSVKIEGDDNIVPLVKTRVEGGTLIISMKESVKTVEKLRVTISMPALEGVQLDGAGSIHIHGMSGPKLEAGINGAGQIVASGSVDDLNASINGAGKLLLSDLPADTASASVHGTGRIEVWAKKSLAASISGVGVIRYRGNPDISKSIQGVGKIEPED